MTLCKTCHYIVEKRLRMALTKAAQKALGQIDDLIDEAYSPDKMSPEEAVEFLEEIAGNIKTKVETLKEENDLE
jgi:polyhydroxyalkanoate synthesis regulator phasin